MDGLEAGQFGRVIADILLVLDMLISFSIASGLTILDISKSASDPKRSPANRRVALISVWKHLPSLLLAAVCGSIAAVVFFVSLRLPQNNILRVITWNQEDPTVKAVISGFAVVVILRTRLSDFNKSYGLGTDRPYLYIRDAVTRARVIASESAEEKLIRSYLKVSRNDKSFIANFGGYTKRRLQSSDLVNWEELVETVDEVLERDKVGGIITETERDQVLTLLIVTALGAAGNLRLLENYLKDYTKSHRSDTLRWSFLNTLR